MDYSKEMHEMCETLGNELKKANEKLRIAGGKMTAADLDYVDKLTHAIKSVKGTMAMSEAQEGEDEYSAAYEGMSRRSYDGMGRGYARAYDDGAGRGSYRNSYRRDSMGRYARSSGLSDRIREMMEEAPDDQTRMELQRLAEKMER